MTTIGPIILMLAMAALMAGCVWVYERELDRVRAERDEALADADLATGLFMAERDAHRRHPVYGGPNLRVVE